LYHFAAVENLKKVFFVMVPIKIARTFL